MLIGYDRLRDLVRFEASLLIPQTIFHEHCCTQVSMPSNAALATHHPN